MSCQMLRRGLIETWDQTKREVASGFKGLKRGHVQTQPLPLLPRMLEALPSPGFSKATINAMQRPRKKSRCQMFAFLATAVTLLKVGIGLSDNFLFRDGTFYSQLSSNWRSLGSPQSFGQFSIYEAEFENLYYCLFQVVYPQYFPGGTLDLFLSMLSLGVELQSF